MSACEECPLLALKFYDLKGRTLTTCPQVLRVTIVSIYKTTEISATRFSYFNFYHSMKLSYCAHPLFGSLLLKLKKQINDKAQAQTGE